MLKQIIFVALCLTAMTVIVQGGEILFSPANKVGFVRVMYPLSSYYNTYCSSTGDAATGPDNSNLSTAFQLCPLTPISLSGDGVVTVANVGSEAAAFIEISSGSPQSFASVQVTNVTTAAQTYVWSPRGQEVVPLPNGAELDKTSSQTASAKFNAGQYFLVRVTEFPSSDPGQGTIAVIKGQVLSLSPPTLHWVLVYPEIPM